MDAPGFFYILSQEHDSLLALNGLVQAAGRSLELQKMPDGSFALQGSFLAGPFQVGAQNTAWHRLLVTTLPLPEGAHLRLYTRTSISPAAPALPPSEVYTGAADELAPFDEWRAARRDAHDLLLLNTPARYLWVCGVFSSDGRNTPQVEQMRVEYERQSWLRYLPAIYTPGERDPTFIYRSLALFQSMLDEQEAHLEELPRLFDPLAAPAEWLDWLAGWLAFDLDETWSEDKRRQALKQAFALQGLRGTVEGLRAMILLYTGAKARIVEPARSAHLWSLGETSTLGFTTMLVPAQAQGAVLATTADLNSSHLLAAEDYGAPLFTDLAHHFCVQVYAAEVAGEVALQRLERVVEREKPAHTTCCVRVIEAEMRVGAQARLGVDAIVPPAAPDAVFNPGIELGVESVLPDDPRPNVLGSKSRLGKDAILGSGLPATSSKADSVEGGDHV
jgi:phage tail-like protein